MPAISTLYGTPTGGTEYDDAREIPDLEFRAQAVLSVFWRGASCGLCSAHLKSECPDERSFVLTDRNPDFITSRAE